MMRLSVASCLLAVLGTANALSSPKPEMSSKIQAAQHFAGAAALAASIVSTTPLVSHAETAPATAFEINVDAKSLAKSAFGHRSELKSAVTKYLSETDNFNKELQNVIPADAISVKIPLDLKATARNALSGQAEVVLNGSPVNLQVESEKGALTFKIASDMLPKVPFLAPLSSVSEPTIAAEESGANVVNASPENSQVGFLDRNVHLNVGDGYDFTYEQIAGGSSLALGVAYGSSYTYYTVQKQQEEEKAAARKAKAAAAKKSKAKAAKKATKPAAPFAKVADPAQETSSAVAQKTASAVETTPVTPTVAIVADETEQKVEEKKGNKVTLEPVVTSTPVATESPPENDTKDDEPSSGRRLKRFLGLKRETVAK